MTLPSFCRTFHTLLFLPSVEELLTELYIKFPTTFGLPAAQAVARLLEKLQSMSWERGQTP